MKVLDYAAKKSQLEAIDKGRKQINQYILISRFVFCVCFIALIALLYISNNGRIFVINAGHKIVGIALFILMFLPSWLRNNFSENFDEQYLVPFLNTILPQISFDIKQNYLESNSYQTKIISPNIDTIIRQIHTDNSTQGINSSIYIMKDKIYSQQNLRLYYSIFYPKLKLKQIYIIAKKDYYTYTKENVDKLINFKNCNYVDTQQLHAEFSRHYFVKAEDVAEAYAVLSTSFLDKILHLNQVVGSKIQLSFVNNTLYAEFPLNFDFTMPNLHQAFDDKKYAETVYNTLNNTLNNRDLLVEQFEYIFENYEKKEVKTVNANWDNNAFDHFIEF